VARIMIFSAGPVGTLVAPATAVSSPAELNLIFSCLGV